MMNMKRMTLVLGLLLLSGGLLAQRSEWKELPLQDMSAFEPQAGNWFIVGLVSIDPTLDIHHEHAPPAAENGKKRKRKKKKNAPAPEPPRKAVSYGPGTGILLNMNNEEQKDHLVTAWEHGDMELELEVMMPKGSNSGIYLQGRYEVQLLDSWGVDDPRYGDIGGIYRNWETEPGNIYMGKAPATNAARAPGLWQHFKIGFKAPRFDQSGKKVANARFVYVELNGVRIHENLEVPLPTGGPIEKNEVATGPLMIQGDHGPVAFRNVRYQLLNQKEIHLKNISYQLFEGDFGKFEEMQGLEPVKSGTQPVLTSDIAGAPQRFGLVLKGNIEVAESGNYDLRLNYLGGARLNIDGKTVAEALGGGGSKAFQVALQQGKTPFKIHYIKNVPWWDARLGLFNYGSYPQPLHAYSSFPPGGSGKGPIYVEPGTSPRMLRAFLDFNGERDKRLTHTMAVGKPDGTHYIYDLKAGNPVCVWRGNFVDATPMWNSRGDGSFRPRGDVQYLFRGLSVAPLASAEAAFPEAMDEAQGFANQGYRVSEDNGLPVFLYHIGGVEVEDALAPDESGNAFSRSVKIGEGTADQQLYLKMAEGEEIKQQPNGYYSVDQRYYIRPADGLQPTIRNQNGKQELVAPVTAGSFDYSIIW